MPFKTIVDPKTGQSRDEFIEPAAGAAPAAKPAAAAKPEQGGFRLPGLGAVTPEALKDAALTYADTLSVGGVGGVSNLLEAANAGITTMAKTGDVGQSLAEAAKAGMKPSFMPRMAVNALRNIAQEPVNVVADLTGRPTTAANPDAPFPGLGRPLPKLATKLGPLEEAATGLLQIGIEFIPVARAVSWGGKALKAIPGVARGVQAVEAARETGLVGLAATGQVGKVAAKGLRVATRAFSPTNVATGAIIDYAGVNPHGGRIYDLVDNVQQQITGTPMELPVLNYFKSRPGDVGSKARLKNALEGGLILGPAQDTLMSLFRAAKYVSRLRGVAPDGAEAAAGQAKQAAQEFEQKAAEFVNSGRPPEPAQAPAAAPAPAQAAPPDAAAAAAAAVAQERYNRAQAKLSTHGPAPAKPSSEKKTFGTRGIANADPAAVARWQLETKAYQGWNRKYLGLKKEEVAAGNELFAAQQKLGTTEPQVTPGTEAAPVLARPADPASGFAIPPEPSAPSVPSAGTSAPAAPAAPAPAPEVPVAPERPLVKAGANLSHGTTEAGKKGILAEGFRASEYERSGTVAGEGVYMTPSERYANEYGGKRVEGALPENAKILDWTGNNQTLASLADEIGIAGPRELIKSFDEVGLNQAQQQQLKQWALDNGYDGIQYRTNFTPGGKAQEVVIYNIDLANRIVGSKAVPTPAPTKLPDTRGQGQFFHGAAAEIKQLDEGFYESSNVYGQGFYTTDDVKTAGSYTKKNVRSVAKAGGTPGQVIYQAVEREPVNFYDLDAPVSPSARQELERVSDRSESVARALDEFDADPNISLAKLMDEIRANSKSAGESNTAIQEIFDGLRETLEAEGYGGFTHVGGRLTKSGREHQVKIYWNPETQLELKPYEAPAAPTGKTKLSEELRTKMNDLGQSLGSLTRTLDEQQRAAMQRLDERAAALDQEAQALTSVAPEGQIPAETKALPQAAVPEPQGPEPVRATMPDDSWVTKVVDQVQANRDALERNDITLDDILENNVQRIQSPSGRTQYVVDNPDMAMGYKAFSDLLSRVEATGIQTASFEQVNVDTEVWLNSVNHNGKDVLTALERISGPLSNYRENLRALRAGQLLTDHANLQAGVAAAQWLNSALGGAVDRNQLGAQLFAAAAAQKQVNVAFEKVTRPIGQLLWSLQNPRPEPGSIPFNMGEEGVAAVPGEAPLPSTKDIKTELETALQEGQGAPVSESLGGTLSPETVEAINTGDFSNPKVQAEMDALAMVLSSGSIDPGFSRNFWTNLPGNVALGARGLNMMHASFLVSSGETLNTNLLNGVVRLIDLPLTQTAGALARGDLASAGTALQMFVGYARSVVGASKLAAHSFRLGRGFYDISHQGVDMMERLATQEATNSLAGVPTEAERVWTINDTPLIDATDKSNGAHALRAVWRTMTGPLRVMTTADTFIKALAGDSFEFTQNLRPGLERAIELGMEPGSKEAWKWANQYAEQVVKAKKRDLIVEGKTITDAIMTSPNALNAARYATFTADVWAEMEWNMPNPATGKPIGRSFERGAQLAAAKNITDPKEVTKFVENYLKNGTPGEAVSEAMMSTVGRTFSLIPEGYTLLSQNARVGPLFQAFQAFIRTPFDMLKSLARKAPTAVLVDTWWRDLNSSNQAIRDKAVGDVALGTTALALTGLAIATSNVRFNGAGPLNEKAKRKWVSGGRMPYSFQMRAGTDPGGMPRWGEARSLRVFEPYTSLIGAMADYIDISGNLSTEQLNTLGANMAGDLFSRVVVGQLSKQYFKGLYDIVDAVMSVGDVESGPNVRNPLNKYLSRFAAGYTIPSAFGSGNRILDQTARSVPASGLASEYLDEVRSKLAGWSKSIPPIVDWVTGEDVVLAGIYGQQHLPADQPWLGLLYQFVPWSPLKVASPPHRVLQEMGALHGKGANFNGPSANDFGVELRLDLKTFNAYKREVATVVRDEAGRTLVEALQQEIDGPQYQALPFAERGTAAPAERVAQLSLIINKFKAMGKQTFLNQPENATLLRQYNERKAKISAVGQGGVEPAQAGGPWSPTPQ